MADGRKPPRSEGDRFSARPCGGHMPRALAVLIRCSPWPLRSGTAIGMRPHRGGAPGCVRLAC
eukprot:6030604-Prymnesium_polylepis.3